MLIKDKQLRNNLKIIAPYFIEAMYVRRVYGLDTTPKWASGFLPLSLIVFFIAQFLPFGLIANQTVLAQHAKTQKVIKKPKPFAVSRKTFVLRNEETLTDKFISDIHAKVMDGLYPQPEVTQREEVNISSSDKETSIDSNNKRAK